MLSQINSIKIFIKLFLLVIAYIFLVSVFPSSIVSAARSDCNKSENKNRCFQVYDACDRLDSKQATERCQRQVIDDYTKSNNGGGGNNGGDKNGGGKNNDKNDNEGSDKCKMTNNPDSCNQDYQMCETLYKDDNKAVKDCQQDTLLRYGVMKDQCGKGEDAIRTRFDFGCVGNRLPNKFSSPIYDLAFALIRFLSIGVGIVVVVMIILAGIQYTTSEGNPEATMQAKSKIQSAIIALIIYIFSFAIIQWLVPGGVFN